MSGRRGAAWRGWLAAGLAAWGVAVAQPRTVTYEATVQGVTSRLTLRIDGAQVEGGLVEGPLTLGVRGALDGQRIRGDLIDPGTGRAVLPLSRDRGRPGPSDLGALTSGRPVACRPSFRTRLG